MKSKYFILLFSLSFGMVFMGLHSCKKESETLGCVSGLINYRGKRLPVGCMTRAEFNDYLKEPFFKDPSSGQLIDKELMFKEVSDCSECN